MMKRKYIAPVCDVCEMEVEYGILVGSDVKVDNNPGDIYLEGDANCNNGWELW